MISNIVKDVLRIIMECNKTYRPNARLLDILMRLKQAVNLLFRESLEL